MVVPTFLGPLTIRGISDHLHDDPLNADEVLAFMGTPGTPHDVQTIWKRYLDLSPEPVPLHMAPHEASILRNLIWPLRQAKASYVVGNYLGCIALCGLVAEKMTLLRYKLYPPRLNDAPFTEADECRITFENLKQSRRIAILEGFGAATLDLTANLRKVADLRNKRLHQWSSIEESAMPGEAREAFVACVAVVVRGLGLKLADGRLSMDPALFGYLQRSGAIDWSTSPTEPPRNDPPPSESAR
jgi:hypothetical protein